MLIEFTAMNTRRVPAAPATPVPDLGRLEEMHEHAAEAARLMKALGNEQRLLILCNLLERPLSVGELNERVHLSQSALSQHLAVLRELRLVQTRREAQSILYWLPPGPVTRVMGLLQEMYCSVPAPQAAGAAARPTPRRRRSGC
jgi:DNA-binding transcriptional ArsR family regulator